MSLRCVLGVLAGSCVAAVSNAQWVGPAAPDNRMKYEGGPVFVGASGLTTTKFGVIESAPGTRIIGSYAFIGTPGNGSRTTALWGETNNPKGRALQGFNFSSADSGDSNNPATGIWAETASPTGQGLRARATATSGQSYGGYFDNASSSGTAVYANSYAVSGFSYGIQVTNASTSGTAILASSTASAGVTTGVLGTVLSSDGTAVFGSNTSSTGTSIGVRGRVISSTGYAGYFEGGRNYFEGNVGIGVGSPSTVLDVFGSSTTGLIYGANTSSASGNSQGSGVAGVKGTITSTSPGSHAAGVWGIVPATAGSQGYGVAGYHNSNGIGVAGFVASTSFGAAVYGNGGATSTTAYAAVFDGRVFVNGTVAKSGGSFRIDHPLDPENKTLSHSFVESPDMMNIYNGIVHTDPSGYATVTMPDWFTALNRDFRYQLTVIDEADSGWALAKVVREMKDGEFTIRTNLPNQKVSWQVTGIRQDAWANKHRIPTEELKSANEKGKYLSPDAYGLPPERGIYHRDPAANLARESEQIMQRQAQIDQENAARAKERRVNSGLSAAPASSALANTPPLVPAIAGGR